MNGTLLYEDFLKLRKAKVGEKVILSDGTEIVKVPDIKEHVTRPSKYSGLETYDHSNENR